MRYIALLRGINVGGKNKIDMKKLKQTFGQAGMQSVVTYINTGNVIFEHEGRNKNELSTALEKVINHDFGLQLRVLVYSYEEFARIAQAVPSAWTNDQQMKSDVLFLWEEVDDESVLDKIPSKPEIDTVKYVPGALLYSVARENVTKSGMMKLVGSELYQLMTIRNVNTVRKLYDLLKNSK